MENLDLLGDGEILLSGKRKIGRFTSPNGQRIQALEPGESATFTWRDYGVNPIRTLTTKFAKASGREFAYSQRKHDGETTATIRRIK